MSVKLMMTGRRRVGQTLADHRRHMRDVHGRIVLDYIAADPGHAPRRYVQNHVLEARLAEGDTRDFVTELWFPDDAAIGASRQTDFYRDRLQPDEANMVDPASVTALVTREVEGPSGPSLGFKVILLHRAAQGRAAFEVGWAAMQTDWPRSRSHVLNPCPFDGVDAVRCASAETAAEFVDTKGQAWLDRLASAGLIAQGSSDVLIAREIVLFDGPEVAQTKGTLP